MIATAILGIINFFWYGFLEILFPKSFFGLTAASFEAHLSHLWDSVGPFLHFINTFFPIYLLLILVVAWVAIHISIFIFQAARFLLSFVPFKPGVK